MIRNSGFEDAVFRSGLCTSGSLKGVSSGSHYNRAWIVHIVFSEAISRILVTRFMNEKNPVIPSCLWDLAADPNPIIIDQQSESLIGFFAEFENYKEACRSGGLGPTAIFWMNYLDMMETQNMIHLAIQENNLEMLIYSWKLILPWYFALNKTNYARYGSVYFNNLVNIDLIYPGLRDLLQNKGMSIQAQESYPSRTSIDQRGEQTINKDAKTAGGIKGFASDPSSVLKWTLNRPEQAKNTRKIKQMAGIETSCEYRPLRRSQVKKSEEQVQNVIRVLNEDYNNPFGLPTESNLVNLSSGVTNDDTNVSELYNNGKKAFEEFTTSRIHSSVVPFYSPIHRNKLKLFQSTSTTVTTSNQLK